MWNAHIWPKDFCYLSGLFEPLCWKCLAVPAAAAAAILLLSVPHLVPRATSGLHSLGKVENLDLFQVEIYN